MIGKLTISQGSKPANYNAVQFLEEVIRKIENDDYLKLQNMFLYHINDLAMNYRIYVP